MVSLEGRDLEAGVSSNSCKATPPHLSTRPSVHDLREVLGGLWVVMSYNPRIPAEILNPKPATAPKNILVIESEVLLKP